MALQRSSYLSLNAFDAFLDGWAEKFAGHPATYRIDGRPVLSVLNVTDFAAVYGVEGFRFMLQYAKKKFIASVGTEPFITGVFAEANAYNVKIANQLPLDGATGYGMLPDWQGPPVQEYEQLIRKRVREWYAIQSTLNVPFFPVVCSGWDATVRGEQTGDINQMKGFPWRPIVVGITPQKFGFFLDEAIQFIDCCHPTWRVIFIHAWNEWTESSAVEPSDRYGTQFLDEIRARANRFSSVGTA